MPEETKAEVTVAVEEKINYKEEVERLQAEKEALLKEKEEQAELLRMRAENEAIKKEITEAGIRFPDQTQPAPVKTARDIEREKLDKLEYALKNLNYDAVPRRADGKSIRAPYEKDEKINGVPMIQAAARYVQAETREEKEAILDEIFKNPWDYSNII